MVAAVVGRDVPAADACAPTEFALLFHIGEPNSSPRSIRATRNGAHPGRFRLGCPVPSHRTPDTFIRCRFGPRSRSRVGAARQRDRGRTEEQVHEVVQHRYLDDTQQRGPGTVPGEGERVVVGGEAGNEAEHPTSRNTAPTISAAGWIGGRVVADAVGR